MQRPLPANFDRERCIDPTVLLPFIQETQPAEWESLNAIHGGDAEAALLDDLCKAMDGQGSLDVLRHGFKCFGKTFRVAYFAPASGMNPDTQRLYAANRLSKLPRPGTGPAYHFDDEVALKYYRLQKVGEWELDLSTGDTVSIYGPTDRGTGASHREMVELSRVIDLLNERFGTQFTPADELFFEQLQAEAVADPELRQAASVNTLENFGHVFDQALQDIVIDRMESNADIVARFMDQAEFRRVVEETLRCRVYDEIRGDAAD